MERQPETLHLTTDILALHQGWRSRMAKVTLVFAVLLIALGLVGYLGTGSLHPTALIPTWFGLALGILACWPSAPTRAGASCSCTLM